MKVAVMQPYFFPYWGYYKLFHQADVFVALDNVQFPRRGWVHRNKFTMIDGRVDWITLPIIKGPRDETMISHLRFSSDAGKRVLDQFRKTLIYGKLESSHFLSKILLNFDSSVADYLVSTLEYVNSLFSFGRPIIRASQMNLPEYFRGEEKIIRIVKELGGSSYINLSGGIHLYNKDNFSLNGIELEFVDEYLGNRVSILERIILKITMGYLMNLIDTPRFNFGQKLYV